MKVLPLILGMSGGEIGFILFIALLVFGAEKIPDIARELGKGIRTIKDATNEIKGEVMKSSEKNGINTNELSGVKEEIDKVKDDLKDITGSIKRRL